LACRRGIFWFIRQRFLNPELVGLSVGFLLGKVIGSRARAQRPAQRVSWDVIILSMKKIYKSYRNLRRVSRFKIIKASDAIIFKCADGARSCLLHARFVRILSPTHLLYAAADGCTTVVRREPQSTLLPATTSPHYVSDIMHAPTSSSSSYVHTCRFSSSIVARCSCLAYSPPWSGISHRSRSQASVEHHVEHFCWFYNRTQ